jgi:DNA-binding LytR/AlgR family response regulator
MNQYKPFYPLAYLFKPLMSRSLFSTIRLAVQGNETSNQPHEELFLKTGTKYEKLDLKQLIFAKANGKYTELHFIFGKRLMRISLTKFIQEKINIELLRVHKSFAVNAEFISSYKSDEIAVGENKIPIGRFFKEDVQNYLKLNTLVLNMQHKS